MGKHIDDLGSYQDFRAPWETESGEEVEPNLGKLKKLLFNARSAKAAALDERDEAREAQKGAEEERDTAKAEAANASPEEAAKKITSLEKENADLKAAATAREEADKHEALRKEVIGDLDPKYAKYVKGETRDELEKSLEEIKADFGIGDDDGADDDDEPTVRTRPRSGLINGTDGKPAKSGEAEIDYDKVANEILGVSIF